MDFDEDGDLDVVLAGWYGSLRLYKSDGLGRFTPGPEYFLPASGWSLGTGDLNGDGHVDVVVLLYGLVALGQVRLWKIDGWHELPHVVN